MTTDRTKARAVQCWLSAAEHQALRVYAVTHGLTVQEVVLHAIRRELKRIGAISTT